MASLKLDPQHRQTIVDAGVQPLCTCDHLLVEHAEDGGTCCADGCSCHLFVEDQER